MQIERLTTCFNAIIALLQQTKGDAVFSELIDYQPTIKIAYLRPKRHLAVKTRVF